MKKIFLVIVLTVGLLAGTIVQAQNPVDRYAYNVLLNAVLTTGAGTSKLLPFAFKAHTWSTTITGTPTTVSVTLEGSIDGTNWFVLDTSTSTSNEMRHVTNKPVTHIRANLGTLSGGSTPTVTVNCLSIAF